MQKGSLAKDKIPLLLEFPLLSANKVHAIIFKGLSITQEHFEQKGVILCEWFLLTLPGSGWCYD